MELLLVADISLPVATSGAGIGSGRAAARLRGAACLAWSVRAGLPLRLARRSVERYAWPASRLPVVIIAGPSANNVTTLSASGKFKARVDAVDR
jgi:hypothetical protein